MDFGEFVNAFGTGYRKMIDRGTNKSLTKPYFCRDLLCSITKDENLVLYIDGIQDKAHEYGESAFQAFYRNVDRRSLHPIAEGIINGNNIDKNKFKHFLEDYVENYDKERLVTDFEKYLPSTSFSTLFDDITNEFVKILREEAAIPDKRRKEPVSPNNANRSNESEDSLEVKMGILLEKLIANGHEIAEFKPTGVGDDIRYSRLKDALTNDFEKLLALSKILPQNTSNDTSPVINDIRCSIQSLKAENFILSTTEFMITSRKNYHIHRLIDLLSQLNDNN